MAYNLHSLTHIELVKKMEDTTLNQTNIPLKFMFELASDGNLDLYRNDEHNFDNEEIKKMVDLGWFEPEILKEIEKQEVEPFEWHEDTLAQSHGLFQFMLAKTFGDGTKIAGVEILDDCVMLNVAVPA